MWILEDVADEGKETGREGCRKEGQEAGRKGGRDRKENGKVEEMDDGGKEK